MQLMRDLVLVRRQDAETKVGSILLPEVAREELQQGKVVSVGPGKWVEGRAGHMIRQPMDVAVGDTVLFSKHGHQVVKVNGEELVTLREDSIVGILDTEPPVHRIPSEHHDLAAEPV